MRAYASSSSALRVLGSVPAPVREVSRGEWWCARTPTGAAAPTAMRGSNRPSPRDATPGPVLCGTSASGER